MAKKKPTNSKLSGKMVNLGDYQPHPDNPRTINDDSLESLKNDLQQLPEMMTERPMIADADSDKPKYLLAGNQRWTGLVALGYEKIPIEWISEVHESDGWTKEKKETLMIKDNLSRGDWSWPKLQSPSWGIEKVEKMGLTLPAMKKPKIGTSNRWIPDCTFETNNKYDIPTLDINHQATGLINPVKPYGSVGRGTVGIGTYFYYVDDYRFLHIWDDPNKVIESGARVIVEPNLSTSDTFPMSYGSYLIFKKRWFSRYMQSFKIKVIADLHVADKFYDINLSGIPKGWNAFATRGYHDEIANIEIEYKQAQKISGKKEPFFVIFGGGKKVKELAMSLNVIHIAQHMRKLDQE